MSSSSYPPPNDALFDILDALSQHRFYLIVYFLLNLPGETGETFEETIDLAKSIYDNYCRDTHRAGSGARTELFRGFKLTQVATLG